MKHFIEVVITWFIHALFWCTIVYFFGRGFFPKMNYIDALTFVSVIGTLKLFFNNEKD